MVSLILLTNPFIFSNVSPIQTRYTKHTYTHTHALLESLYIIGIHCNYICVRIPTIVCIPKNNGTFQNSNIFDRLMTPRIISNNQKLEHNSKTYSLGKTINPLFLSRAVCKLNPYILKLLYVVLKLLLLLFTILTRARGHTPEPLLSTVSLTRMS